MKKYQKHLSLIFTLLLFVSINTISAQRNRMKTRLNHSVDIVLGGDVGFRLINYNNDDSELVTQKENRNQFETYKPNWRFGLNFNLGLTKNLQLKTGLRYANPGFSIKTVEQFDVKQDINLVQKEFLTQGYVYKYQYHILEIPLGLKAFIGEGSCTPYVEFGVAPAFYSFTRIHEESHEGEQHSFTTQENIKTLNFMSFLSLGGDFKITRKIAGFTQLNLRYQLNNLRHSPVEEKLVGLGLEMGIRFYLE